MNTTRIIKRLKEDTAYQEFFRKAMKKFDISSPTDLKDPEKKKNFFNYVDSNYSAKTEDVRIPRGVSGQYAPAIQQMKSVMQTFFQKLPLAPRDVQRDFAQLYKSITKQSMVQLNKFEIEKIMDVLKPVLEKSGFKLKINDRELAMAFSTALSQTKNINTKVPASVLAETYFPTNSNDEPSLRDAKKALANFFGNIMQNSNSPIIRGKLDTKQLDILYDLIDDYAMEYARDYADNIDMERNTF
jgi:hypothetical protein